MKKQSLIALLCATVGLTSSFVQAVPMVLENRYGAPIEYIEDMASQGEDYVKNPKLSYRITRIDNGKQNSIGRYSDEFLSIRKPGGSFSDVSYILNKVRAEESQHKSQRAVIVVQTGWNPMYWNLALEWR